MSNKFLKGRYINQRITDEVLGRINRECGALNGISANDVERILIILKHMPKDWISSDKIRE